MTNSNYVSYQLTRRTVHLQSQLSHVDVRDETGTGVSKKKVRAVNNSQLPSMVVITISISITVQSIVIISMSVYSISMVMLIHCNQIR